MNPTLAKDSIPRSKPFTSASTRFAAFGCLAIAGFVLWPLTGFGEDGQSYYYTGVSAATTVAVAVGAHRVHPSQRLPWLLLAAGQFSYTVGDVVYDVAHTVFGNDSFPGPADLFYLLQYPLLCWALVLLVRRRTPSWDTTTLLDATVPAISLGMLWWLYLIGPLALDFDESESMAGTLVSIAYPVMDLILLATAIRLAVGAGSRPTAFRLLMASLLAMLAGDLLFGLETASDTYQDGGAPDVLWLCEYVLMGTAALHTSTRTLDRRVKVALPSVTAGRVIMLSLAAIFPFLILYVQYVTNQLVGIPIVLLCGIFLFALVMIRMWKTLAIQQRRAVVDDLTGMMARGVLLSHLGLEVDRARRRQYEAGLILIDVDQFKLVAQIHGQSGGQEVLIELSHRLIRLCGQAAILGRMGDDGFAVILPGYTKADLAHAAATIREVVAQDKFPIGDQDEVRVTVSAGVASLHHDGDNSAQLLSCATGALQRAKSAGRNRVYGSEGPVEQRL